uniref:RNA-binding protein RO60 vWA domain-containing protein n=1 Tax=Plectus sambesii TaxID=2011161 RepID=A0A914VG53_9BILA
MGCHIRGSSLSCSEAAAAMAMVSLRTEPLVETVAFSNRLTVLPFEKDWSLGQRDRLRAPDDVGNGTEENLRRLHCHHRQRDLLWRCK